MNGGPSQMDLFDPKPMLEKHHGEPYFDKVAADLTTPESAGGLLRSPFKFASNSGNPELGSQTRCLISVR